jgi:hypothetical protein
MREFALPVLALAILGQMGLLFPPAVSAQVTSDNIISGHVRLRIPMEREWLGRDVVSDLDRCWVYVNGATGDKMPRRILVDIRWDESDSRVDPVEGWVVVGMKEPAAAANMRAFLLHSAVRAMGRLGLLSLSKGVAPREEEEFLIEGMSELLAREYTRTTRSLVGAWVLAQLLDRMNLLGLKTQMAWPAFSEGRHDLRAAAPGITFIMTCRERFGRDKVIKFFEALHKGSLEESIASTFKTNAATLEGAWLKKVREFRAGEDFTATSEEEAPRLERTESIPATGRPGAAIQLRLFIRPGANALLPERIYVLDEVSDRILQARASVEKEAKFSWVDLPIEADRKPGSYNLKIVALDEGGNVRTWKGTYTVAP